MASQQKKGDKYAHMKKIYNNIAREVGTLNNKLEGLEKKELFLRSEVLLHQATVLSEEDEEGFVSSSNSKLLLKPEQVESLQEQIDRRKKTAIIAVSQVNHKVERVEGLNEPLNVDPNAMDTSDSGQAEKGILKTVRVDGSIGKFNYKLECLANYLMEKRGGEITKIHQLDINPLPDIIKKLLKLPQALEPSHIAFTLNNLHYLQMLQDERREAVNNFEDDVPNLIIKKDSEPLVLEFNPTQGISIRINWGIVLDAKNFRLKYEIALNCSEDDIAYYSQNEEVYPYLSAKETLRTSEDLADFLDAFEN